MNNKLILSQKALLLVAGALLSLIAIMIIASPVSFYAANDIELGSSVSLLNELKAPAGVLLVAGLFMLAAVFVRRLADTATGLGALIYLSYAASRGISMALDGAPAAGLVQAAALEAAIGLACLAALTIRRMPARKVA